MATLDKVMEMQRQGLSDAQIASQLQNEGVSPQEVNNSLNQARVKNAVSSDDATPVAPGMEGMTGGTPGMEGMVGSAGLPQGGGPAGMPGGADPFAGTAPSGDASMAGSNDGFMSGGVPSGMMPSPDIGPPMPSDMMAPQGMPGMQASTMDGGPGPGGPAPMAPPSPEMYPSDPGMEGYVDPSQGGGYDAYYQQTPQAYDDASGYYDAGYPAMDTETIAEIAEQVANEKIDEFQHKTGDLVRFRNDVHEKIVDLDDRLGKIEDSIDQLKHAIIGKIGEFGDNTARIHQDLENMHGTMSKMMNPLVDNYNELKRISEKN